VQEREEKKWKEKMERKMEIKKWKEKNKNTNKRICRLQVTPQFAFVESAGYCFRWLT
jgi:hypothetical protein